MSPTEPQTISEAISGDHKSLDEYADKIRSSTSLEDKTKWRNQLTWALARHAISEELTMYPAMEKHLGEEGLQLTNTDREQHQAVSTFATSAVLQLSLTRPVGQRRPLQTAVPLPLIVRFFATTRPPHDRPP